MRIGIDARMYGPKATTGIGNYIKKLTEELFALDRQNEYFLFMNEPAYSQYQPPNARIKKIKVNCRWYTFKEQLVMPFFLWRFRLDLVHFPHFNAAIFYPKKFIITIHDLTPKFFPGPLVRRSITRRLGYNFIFKISLWRAKKILTISEHTKKNLQKYFQVPDEKIKVIYLAGNLKAAWAEKKDLADFQIKNKLTEPFLLYVGVWRDHKNLPGLIKAFNLLKSKYGFAGRLVLGGQADGRYPEIQQAINDSPYKNDILTPGFISEADLPYYYQSAKLFILPSFCEGFGLVALEAANFGLPVAASNSTSLPEIMADSAVYFNPHDFEEMAKVIFRAISDYDFHLKLKELSKKQANKYSWTECARETLKVYETV